MNEERTKERKQKNEEDVKSDSDDIDLKRSQFK